VLVKGDFARALIESQLTEISLLARIERLSFVSDFPGGGQLARGVVRDMEIAIDLAGILDLGAERERLQKELKKISTDLSQVEKKLSNENFLKNAPPEIVAEQKAKFEDLNSRKSRTERHLQTLG
jgi:valyl-tRNA synthetase